MAAEFADDTDVRSPIGFFFGGHLKGGTQVVNMIFEHLSPAPVGRRPRKSAWA
ncbi:MAG: hypothetical protein JWN15_1188, partial [Firmicutes bacterium]|nr:hypothetical protein [Bacillota bacterium]